MKERIFLSSPHMSDEGYEMKFIQEAFTSNWIAPMGNNVNLFEKEIANLMGVKAATALISGTSAIHLALKLAGLKEGDKVFCQSLTFSASANPILYEKGIPVFIDSDLKSWNMDPVALEKAFIKYPQTKIVIVVHLYGFNADMDKIVQICNKYGATLIEDAAESLGSNYKGKSSGSIGDFGIYSFNGNKIITSSGGGMLVSNNVDAINKARFWATQSREDEIFYHHLELGYNYRMSNIVAGIGRGQLLVLMNRVAKKKEIYELYKKELSSLKGVSFMPVNTWDSPNYWLTAMIVENDNVHIEKIISYLESNNIESRPIWKPMHLQPFFHSYDFIGEGVCEEIFRNGICLPSDTKMTVEDQLRVIGLIKDVFENAKV